MVELDPSSGARHGSVLRTLASYRRSHAKIDFGVFCEVAARGQGGKGGEGALEARKQGGACDQATTEGGVSGNGGEGVVEARGEGVTSGRAATLGGVSANGRAGGQSGKREECYFYVEEGAIVEPVALKPQTA
jgi:hypothetical protein